VSPSPTTAPRVWQDSDLLNGSGMFQLRSLVSAKIRTSECGADPSASWADMELSWIPENSVDEWYLQTAGAKHRESDECRRFKEETISQL